MRGLGAPVPPSSRQRAGRRPACWPRPAATHLLGVLAQGDAQVPEPLLQLVDVHHAVAVAVQLLEEGLVARRLLGALAGRRGQHEAPQPAQHGPGGAGRPSGGQAPGAWLEGARGAQDAEPRPHPRPARRAGRGRARRCSGRSSPRSGLRQTREGRAWRGQGRAGSARAAAGAREGPWALGGECRSVPAVRGRGERSKLPEAVGFSVSYPGPFGAQVTSLRAPFPSGLEPWHTAPEVVLAAWKLRQVELCLADLYLTQLSFSCDSTGTTHLWACFLFTKK